MKELYPNMKRSEKCSFMRFCDLLTNLTKQSYVKQKIEKFPPKNLIGDYVR